MKRHESLWAAFASVHYTDEQKALVAMILLLGVVAFLAEIRLPGLLFRWVGTILRSNLAKGGKGIQLGPVFLQDSERVRHTHIVGSPGSGKTEATKALIFEDIRRGRGCFIIDAKGDRELYDEVKAFCVKAEREGDLKLLSATFPSESSVWNPCGLGNASELQSKFLNSNVYSEAFYAKACELGLLQAFNRLTKSESGGFNVADLVQKLKSLADEQKNKYIEGLFFDFGSLAECEWGEILGCSGAGQSSREISLLDIVQNNQILFVHLPTEGKSIQSSRIGRLLTQELILISGLRKSFPSLNQTGVFSIFIDEFDAFATESFITFLNKGRSSNFMIHLAHQTLSDLKRVSPVFAGQVLGNCNVHLIFRQDDPDDAELWARFMGTKTVTKRTFQTQDGSKTGASSNRESLEFIVSPDQIKNLGVGQCVVSIKTRRLHRITKLPLPAQHRLNVVSTSDFNETGRFRKLVAEKFKLGTEIAAPIISNKIAGNQKWDFIQSNLIKKEKI
jgi:hypothetical protein